MKLLLPALLFSVTAYGAENQSSLSTVYGDKTTAPIDSSDRNGVPGDKVVPPLDGGQIDSLVEKAKKTWAEENQKAASALVDAPKPVVVKTNDEPPQIREPSEPKPSLFKYPRHRAVVEVPEPQVVRYFQPSGQSVTIFETNLRSRDEETITLPSGSHAFGRVKFGEEVTADGDSEVAVELDYAFLGPNKSVVEMNGCVAWLKVKSNFHTQRVKGQVADLTCTMPSGRVFTILMEGPLISAASGYAGVDSDVIMRGPAKAAALKFLGDITSAYGAATAATEMTQQVMTAGERFAEKTTNVTGDKGKYVAGKVVEANGDFLKYISSFFQSMQPTLALAPGAKVHIVNRYNVRIPKVFFKGKEKTNG